MDDNMVRQLLRTYKGVDPGSNRNMNMAREFFASNPELAEKRAMGMRGSGIDDNSDVLSGMLDQLVAQTAAPAPQGQVQVGQPQVQAIAPQQRQAAPTLMPRRGAAPQTEPVGTSGVVGGKAADPRISGTNQINPDIDSIARAGIDTGVASQIGGGIGDWLLALLGASAAVPRGVNGVPGRQTPGSVSDAVDLNTRALPSPVENATRVPVNGLTMEPESGRVGYQPKLENNAPSSVTNSPELNTAGKNRADKYAKDYANVQEENVRDQMLMDQQMKQRKSQNETRELLKAGRRATGRR